MPAAGDSKLYRSEKSRLVLDVLELDVLREPRRRPRTCSARRRCPAISIPRSFGLRRCAPRPSRPAPRGGSAAAAPDCPARPRGTRRTRPPTSTRGAPDGLGSASSNPSRVFLAPSPRGRARRARRGRGRTRSRSAPRRGRAAAPRRRRSTPRSVAAARPRDRPEARSAASRSMTRSATCLSAPCSRGPSASNSVSFPARASEPTSVNASVRSITCIPR